MSKIANTPNASGTGTFTIAAPNSDTDRTLTLPDEAGTVLTSASSIPATSLSGNVAIEASKSMPFFMQARTGSNQNINGSTWTDVSFNTTVADTNNWISGGYFTPQIAGWYIFHINLSISSAGITFAAMRLFRQSTEVFVTSHLSTDQTLYNGGTLPIYMNGSTDYIKAQGYVEGVNSSQIRGYSNYSSSLSGYLLRADA